MIGLIFGGGFFYLPISLGAYAIVEVITKRVISRQIKVSGLRHTIAIVFIALLSAATALGLTRLYGNPNLLPNIDDSNQFIVWGLPFVYSIVFAYIVRAVPIRYSTPPLLESEKSLMKAENSPNSIHLKTLCAFLSIALVLALFYISLNRQPRNYDECVIKNTPAAQTVVAVTVIRASCAELFTRT